MDNQKNDLEQAKAEVLAKLEKMCGVEGTRLKTTRQLQELMMAMMGMPEFAVRFLPPIKPATATGRLEDELPTQFNPFENPLLVMINNSRGIESQLANLNVLGKYTIQTGETFADGVEDGILALQARPTRAQGQTDGYDATMSLIPEFTYRPSDELQKLKTEFEAALPGRLMEKLLAVNPMLDGWL